MEAANQSDIELRRKSYRSGAELAIFDKVIDNDNLRNRIRSCRASDPGRKDGKRWEYMMM